MEKNTYIVIEGNIGAGKTTLVNRLAQDIDARKVLEQYADNPFLPKFYNKPDKYSFQLELSFLAARYHQLHKELSNRDLFQPRTLADYYFVKSLIFAKATLSDDEFKLYQSLFSIIHKQLPVPDLYVYLHLSTERLLEQIKERGRPYEQHITGDYLSSIQKGYFDFFKQQLNFPVVIVDVNTKDFVHNEENYEQLKSLIFNRNYEQKIYKYEL
jgi:deoxyadenosine/deoxycytidine kinase